MIIRNRLHWGDMILKNSDVQMPPEKNLEHAQVQPLFLTKAGSNKTFGVLLRAAQHHSTTALRAMFTCLQQNPLNMPRPQQLFSTDGFRMQLSAYVFG